MKKLVVLRINSINGIGGYFTGLRRGGKNLQNWYVY